MKSILEDIRNNSYRQVYLLYGTETYLRSQYRDKLTSALIGTGDEMNVSRFSGKGFDDAALIDLAETLPFLSERRVIVVENSGCFKAKSERLADYISEVPSYTHIIFSEDEVDKRGRLYKAVAKNGRAVAFDTQDAQTLTKWVLYRLKSDGKQIRRPDLELFFQRTGSDMGNIANELEKLIGYTGGRTEITGADIEAVVTPRLENHIFDMIRAVTAKNQERALALYRDLLALKEPPLRILALLAREFNMLLQVKSLADSGYDVRRTAEKTGLRDFAVRKYLPLAGRYRFATIQGAMADCVQAETDIKTGKIADGMSVELLLIKYSSKIS